MTLSNDAIEGYLLMSCSETYFTPEVIVGFAKNSAFLEKTSDESRLEYLGERDKLLSELKEDFSLKKIKPILEKLVEEGKLKKDRRQVFKRKKGTYKTVYQAKTLSPF